MKIIYASNRAEILVSDNDYHFLTRFHWHDERSKKPNTTKHYAVTMLARTNVRMHYLVMGNAPDGSQIDHIDGNGLNNQRENLRFIYASANCQNRKTLRKRNSNYQGVTYCNRYRQPWICQVWHNKKKVYYGRFSSELEAARAYDQVAYNFYGEHCFRNFPECTRGRAK